MFVHISVNYFSSPQGELVTTLVGISILTKQKLNILIIWTYFLYTLASIER